VLLKGGIYYTNPRRRGQSGGEDANVGLSSMAFNSLLHTAPTTHFVRADIVLYRGGILKYGKLLDGVQVPSIYDIAGSGVVANRHDHSGAGVAGKG